MGALYTTLQLIFAALVMIGGGLLAWDCYNDYKKRKRLHPTDRRRDPEIQIHADTLDFPQPASSQSQADQSHSNFDETPYSSASSPEYAVGLPPHRPSALQTVALILKAPAGQPYTGQEIFEVANSLQLQLGKEGYLEHVTTTDYGDEVVYRIGHLGSPGRFNTDDIYQIDIPGLVLFMDIPGPDYDLPAIDFLLAGVATFGRILGGTLQDESGVPYSRDGILLLRENVAMLESDAWKTAE